MTEVPGFEDPHATVEFNEDETDSRQKKKNSKKSGGFQSMNLSYNVLKGVIKRGYKQPTPIQRKVSLLLVSQQSVLSVI